ncbi:signal recognition particle-docking protein FtsY [Candidatus Woesearchaeota archaeon]|nr:signal recognition particle-docking protein FtsY [Candidatus Woesearchaeota archaeon]
MEVLLKGKSWEQAFKDDWRNAKQWQPGWNYWTEKPVQISERKVLEEKKIKEAGLKAKEEAEELKEEKKGFFTRIKETFTTRTISEEKFGELFWDLEVALLENNVSVEVIERIKDDLKKELVDKPLPWDVSKKVTETLKQTLQEIVSVEKVNVLEMAGERKPLVIAFFGINGAGKTTSIAKLARYFQQHKLTVVLAAADTFRAAAIQQLEEHAHKLGVKTIKHDYGADAAAVAYDAVKYAEKNKIDVVLIDTAGRLHSNTNLMSELQKIIRVSKPDLKIFVGESITGNDCIEQARTFNQLVDLDGVILTKADVDEKGGAPLSIAYTIKKPILFLGTGQKYEDLEEFKAEVVLGRLGL